MSSFYGGASIYGAGNGSGGTSDYNDLQNVPVKNLVGAESNPIILSQLQEGNYILTGFYKFTETDSEINRINRTEISVANDIVTDEKIDAIRGNIKYQLSRRKDYFTILLSHRADLYPQIKDTGVDLILSGHIQGGIVRLPFVGGLIDRNRKVSLSVDYEYGVYKEGESATMIVSAGCDKNPQKRRFFNPPEVLLITLKGEQL